MRYFSLTNGWSDLNEILYLEGIHVSELLFQIPTRSFDIGGSWRGNRNSWKTWKLGYFYLTNWWSDFDEIWYLEGIHVSELLFQIPTRYFEIGGNWRRKSWKTLGVEESGWSLVDGINKCPWYVIDRIVLDSLSLEVFGGGVQWFGEFGASGRARTMKIGRRVRELHKLTW